MTQTEVQPPKCPFCPEHPLLWKDTSTATIHDPEAWCWHCTGCSHEWVPTAEHKKRFTWDTSRTP